MDQESTIRGFKFIFGIDIEEVAIRFYNLFTDPPGKTKKTNIDILRFLYVARMICETSKDESAALGFRFYDYNNNGSIGSVDIQNLIKDFDQ